MFYHVLALTGTICTPLQERGGLEEAPEQKDKVQTLKDQVDGVTNIMTQNVNRIIARGERLDELMGKSEDLQEGVSFTTEVLLGLGLCRTGL